MTAAEIELPGSAEEHLATTGAAIDNGLMPVRPIH